jgi:hypothetical protein
VWQNLAIFGGRPIGAMVEALLTKVVNQFVGFVVAACHAAVSIITQSNGAESIIFSVGSAETIMLSAHTENIIPVLPTESMIFSAPPAESMILSAPPADATRKHTGKVRCNALCLKIARVINNKINNVL